MVEEIKGDVYRASGKYQDASTAYLAALKESEQRGIGNPFLEIKSLEVSALALNLNTKDTKKIS